MALDPMGSGTALKSQEREQVWSAGGRGHSGPPQSRAAGFTAAIVRVFPLAETLAFPSGQSARGPEDRWEGCRGPGQQAGTISTLCQEGRFWKKPHSAQRPVSKALEVSVWVYAKEAQEEENESGSGGRRLGRRRDSKNRRSMHFFSSATSS